MDFWELPDGIDYLIRPVYAGMCRYESLKDGTLTLEDILLMNVYLDNYAHNREILQGIRNGNRT